MFVWIIFSSCTFFEIKSIVLSRGTLLNRLFTSKEIILYPAGIVFSLSLLIKYSVLEMLDSDLRNGVKSVFHKLPFISIM